MATGRGTVTRREADRVNVTEAVKHVKSGMALRYVEPSSPTSFFN